MLKRQQRQHGCTSCLHVPCRCSTGQRGGQRCIASTLYSFVSHTRIGRHPADRSPGLSPGLTPKRKKQRRLNTFNKFRLRNSRSTPPPRPLSCLSSVLRNTATIVPQKTKRRQPHTKTPTNKGCCRTQSMQRVLLRHMRRKPSPPTHSTHHSFPPLPPSTPPHPTFRAFSRRVSVSMASMSMAPIENSGPAGRRLGRLTTHTGCLEHRARVV